MHQDCMSGSIDNNFIIVIRNDEEIPELWKEMQNVHILRVYHGNKSTWYRTY